MAVEQCYVTPWSGPPTGVDTHLATLLASIAPGDLADAIRLIRHHFATAVSGRTWSVHLQQDRAVSWAVPNPLRIALGIQLPEGVSGWWGFQDSVQRGDSQAGPPGVELPAGSSQLFGPENQLALWIVGDSSARATAIELLRAY